MRSLCAILWGGLLMAVGSIMPTQGAQNYYFSHLTGDSGLSHNAVKCITQDSYGFIWIGTRNGLNRYDGQTVRIMDCTDSISGHGDNNISALCEDSERRLWVGTDKGVFIYDPMLDIFTHFTEQTSENIAISNWISEIGVDNNGNVWVVSPLEGVFRWDGERLYHYGTTPDSNHNLPHPESMCIRSNGQVWIGTNRAGIFRYYPDRDNFEQVLTDGRGGSFKEDYIFSICEYQSSLAIAVHEGELKKYDIQTGTISSIAVPRLDRTIIRDVQWFGGSELWVATHDGVMVIDEQAGSATHLREEAFNPYSLSDKTCGVIYQDNEKGIWVGTMLGGVNYCANNSLDFDKYIPYDHRQEVLGKRIRGLAEGFDGRIWIGTEDEGICVLNPETGETYAVEYQRAQREGLTNTLGISIYDGKLWYGIFKHGLGVVDLLSGTLTGYNTSSLGVGEESVYATFKDSHGNMWLSTESNIYLCRQGSNDFVVVDKLKGVWVWSIAEDSRGNIWFSCMGMGLRRYDPTDGSIREYTNSPDDPSSLSSNSVNSVFEDSVGRIWVSTDRGGLCLYSYETDDFKSYSTREGLPDDVVYDVLEDSYGMLWFGTNRGLVKFDPESEKVLVYTREDGLLGNQFNYGAAVKDRNGKLWFGGVDGIISFLPKERVSRDFTPPMYITRLSINNIEQTPLAGGSPLRSSILFTDHITLEHKQSNIGIEFAAVHFSGNGTQDYLYRMDGLDDNWIELGSSNEVYYSQLAHGNYVLHVKAVNNSDGWESSAPPLSFVVRPPWWWSSLAKVVYLLTAIGITILVVHIVLRRRHRQMVEQQRLFETEKEKELYRSKINFFNEIAHEVRTPLTLINAPLEDVIEMNSDPKIDKNLKTISKNTRRLLELTHELLDFKNVDASKIRVEYRAVDILSLVVEVIERFEPSILKRGKTLLFDQGGNGFLATVDRDAVTKIMSNLLSNAMKYAASRISVSVYNNGNWFSIKVASDGEKIPVHLADRIFEPFYRMDTVSSIPGTGIGLSLSRSLAQIQKGNLFLDVNSEHKDNIFVLTLPIQAAGATTPPESADSSEQLLPDPETASVSTIDNGYKVLLAEDNNSLRDYLADRLRESCIVMTATNGVEALKILKTQSFDVVVSDIMMPEMDGMELCRRMKHDENLQYTPVVFLTARGDIQAKIDGLQEGAEAFVEKPFSFAYLRALIFSIMDNRKKEREAFAKLPFAPVSDIKINAADREFIDKVIDTIYKNITDENLNVESLADKMYMNRSSLLRKIKGISGISAVEFIKVVRLKEAAKMLGERRYQINEVCYAVGINSPSYFSKLFQQQFGMLPKEFERQSHRSAE